MFHYTYENNSDLVITMSRFSSITAVGHYQNGRRFRLSDILFRPGFRVFSGYVLKGGFLDGLPGFIVAITTGFAVFIKYAKLWEQQITQKSDQNKVPDEEPEK